MAFVIHYYLLKGGQSPIHVFSTAYTQNPYLSHKSWNLTLKHQNHTQNLQSHTPILGFLVFTPFPIS